MIVINIPGGSKESDGLMLWHQEGGRKERESEKKGCAVDEEKKKTECYDDEESRDLYTEIEEAEVLRVAPPPPPPPLPPRQVTLRRCFLDFICTLSFAELFSIETENNSKQAM